MLTAIENLIVSGTVLFSMTGGPLLVLVGVPSMLYFKFGSMQPLTRLAITLACLGVGLGYRWLEYRMGPSRDGDGGFQGLLRLSQYGWYVVGCVFGVATAAYQLI